MGNGSVLPRKDLVDVIVSLLLGVLALGFQLGLGLLVTIWLDTQNQLCLVERLAAAVVVGLIGSGFLLTVLLVLTRTWLISIGVFFVFVLVVGALGRSSLRDFILKLPKPWDLVQRVKTSWATVITFVGFLAVYVVQLVTILIRDSTGGLAATTRQSFKDVAYHLNIIGRLRIDPFVLDHPVAAGERLNYPFLVDLLTAFYQNLGMPFLVAWNLPMILLALACFVLVYSLGQRLFSNRYFSLALLIVVFLGSGMNFIWYLDGLGQAWLSSGLDGVVQAFVEYPGAGSPYWRVSFTPGEKVNADLFWMAPMFVFFSMQRAFVGGGSLAFLLLLGFEGYARTDGRWRWVLLWGFLPLAHTHTFIAVGAVLPVFLLWNYEHFYSDLKGVFTGFLLALPQILYLFPQDVQGGNVTTFLDPWLGWMYCGHNSHWFYCDFAHRRMGLGLIDFLIVNFGVVFLAWCLALVYFSVVRTRDGESGRYFVGSLILFVLPLTVKWQPWIFDNNKLIFYWWVFAAILVFMMIQSVNLRNWATGVLLVVFTVTATFSGIIEIGYRIRNNTSTPFYPYYDNEDKELAEWIRSNTRSDARFLTSSSPDQFIPMLTGRSIYKGSSGWLWSQGKNALRKSRKQALQRFVRLGRTKRLCRDGVDYVLWDRNLKNELALVNRDAMFRKLRLVRGLGASGDIEAPGLYRLECNS